VRRLFDNAAIFDTHFTGNPENALEISRRLTRHSPAAECLLAALPVGRRLGEGGKFRLIVERSRQNIQPRGEGGVIIAFHRSTQRALPRYPA